MNPGGYSVMVRKGYSSISKLLLFIEGLNIAPPPLPVLPADAFSEPPKDEGKITEKKLYS